MMIAKKQLEKQMLCEHAKNVIYMFFLLDANDVDHVFVISIYLLSVSSNVELCLLHL